MMPLYVLKRGPDCERTLDEVAADAIYTACGVNVPPSRCVTDEAGLVWRAARWIAGTRLDKWTKTGHAADVARQIRGGFAVDVLLGNYDVVGQAQQNIVVDADGTAWRVDQGACFAWRPWETAESTARVLRTGAATQCLFGSLTNEDIAAQVAALPGELILNLTPRWHRVPVANRLAALRTLFPVEGTSQSPFQMKTGGLEVPSTP